MANRSSFTTSDASRAAAREQLMTWGERDNIAVVAQESGDPAAVIFDAIRRQGPRAWISCSPIPPADCQRNCT